MVSYKITSPLKFDMYYQGKHLLKIRLVQGIPALTLQVVLEKLQLSREILRLEELRSCCKLLRQILNVFSIYNGLSLTTTTEFPKI